MSQLKLFLFGPPRLERGGKDIQISRRKVLALLIYLAVTRQPHSRDALATLLWPDSDQATGRGHLRRSLYRLHQPLGETVLEATPETISLNPEADLWLDVQAFQQHAEACLSSGSPADEPGPDCLSRLTEAADLYTGEFLAGFTLPDCPDFDEWQFFQGETHRRSLGQVLQQLVTAYQGLARFEPAIVYARRWLALDPLHEPAHRCLMQLYANSDQQAAALRQYQECVRLLEEELGLPPEEETTTLAEAIKAKRLLSPFLRDRQRSSTAAQLQPLEPEPTGPRPGVAAPALLSQPAAGLYHLPAQITPFVGREQELAEIEALLAGPECRLLTLIGPGGIGKTRLSIEAARRTTFAHGVWFVPLAPLSSADSLVSAIAGRLGLNFYGADDPKQHLCSYLSDRRLLLLLDNFEHMINESADEEYGGASVVLDLLEAAPHIKILASSRERLNIGAEWIFTVDGLSLPAGGREQEVETYSGVQLFMQHARRMRRDVGQHEEELGDIVKICRMVGGSPLAIELAAAWVKVLPCAEIVQEIERNLDFLDTSLSYLPERHRNMRVVFDSSWAMLTGEERRLVQRLSVFGGGGSRAAVEAVGGEMEWSGEDFVLSESGEFQLGQRQLNVLHILSGLVDKSFIRYTASGRYELHELTRQYGAEKLAESEREERRTRDRHCLYYLLLLAGQEPRMKGGELRAAHQRVTGDWENIKIAWQWAAEQGRTELILRACEPLWLFFAEGNMFLESSQLLNRTAAALEKVSARQQPAAELVLGVVLGMRAGSLMRTGNYSEAISALDRALTLLEPLQAYRWLGLILNWKASAWSLLGAYKKARLCLIESLELSQQAGDQWLVAYSLNDLGLVTHLLGDTDEAQRLSQQSLATFVELNDRRGMAFAFNNLGLFAYHLADYIEADWFYRESLHMRHANGDLWGVASAQLHLGRVSQARGNRKGARAHLLQAIQTATEIRALPEILEAMIELATLLKTEGRAEQAAHILQVCFGHPALNQQAMKKVKQLLASRPGAAVPPAIVESPKDVADQALNVLISQLLTESSQEKRRR